MASSDWETGLIFCCLGSFLSRAEKARGGLNYCFGDCGCGSLFFLLLLIRGLDTSQLIGVLVSDGVPEPVLISIPEFSLRDKLPS